MRPADASVPWPPGDGWQSLFDGKSLDGWRRVDAATFARHGEVRITGGRLVLEAGDHHTGVVCQKEVPTIDYEVALEAMRVSGKSDFCNLIFPVGPSCCVLKLGGYETVVGLDNVNGRSFNNNETTRHILYNQEEWYKVRLQVTSARIEAWINEVKVVDLPAEGRTFTLWSEYDYLKPLGLCTWDTTAAFRNIQWRALKPESPKNP